MSPASLPTSTLDRILTAQLAVAWAGEAGEPRRLGWWRTDFVSEFGGQDLFALGFEVCRAALGALTSDEAYPYLHETAAAVLAERREAFAGILRPDRSGIEVDAAPDGGTEVGWWTFAGGRVNGTLRYALEAVGGDWKVIPDNHLVKVRGDHVDRAALEAAIARLAEPAFWKDAALWDEIAGSLPVYRLSKFQPLMPEWVEREMVAAYLLDIPGARRVAEEWRAD